MGCAEPSGSIQAGFWPKTEGAGVREGLGFFLCKEVMCEERD